MNRFVLILIMAGTQGVLAQSLRVATINVWSGLDYRGVFRMGELEEDSVRQQRLSILLDELRSLQTDIVFLQECNPVGSVSSFLADGLGYEEIHLRMNAGLKIGPLGIPTNLNEGLAILARPGLGLAFLDVWGLSSRFGAYGDVLSLHLEDQNAALVGRIRVDGVPVMLVNVHLSAATPDDSSTRAILERLLDENEVDTTERKRMLDEFSERAQERAGQVLRLLENLHENTQGIPMIVGGDFNAAPGAEEILPLQSALFSVSDKTIVTWDPDVNPNIRHSTGKGREPSLLALLESAYDAKPRQIDHIFLGGGFHGSDVRVVKRFADTPKRGLYPSDHYGIFADIDCGTMRRPGKAVGEAGAEFDALPILTYDTDVGFGYGAKCFLLRALGKSESFDLVLFNSTQGERWYRLVFSIPDFELRQGTRYALSLDVIVDYDKYLKNNFFGTGRHSDKDDGETYTKEPLEFHLIASKGFTERIVGQIGLKFKSVRNVAYDSSGLFAALAPVNHGRSSGLTLFGSFRYDSRDSYINPSRGNVVQADLGHGMGILSDYTSVSAGLFLQTYHTLMYPKTVLAARVMAQMTSGSGLPAHVLPSLGGNRTLRGYPQDRFIDRLAVVSNVEIRFPFVWRFGGVLFYDAGQIATRWRNFELGSGWKINTGIGLRFMMDTFLVRADLGLSSEGSGFYFNFGHLF